MRDSVSENSTSDCSAPVFEGSGEFPLTDFHVPDDAVRVGVGESTIVTSDVAVTFSLGTCVAVVMYDPETGVLGLLHAILPTIQNPMPGTDSPYTYVDSGVTALYDELDRRDDVDTSRTDCVVIGGGRVRNGVLAPGKDNFERAKQCTQSLEFNDIDMFQLCENGASVVADPSGILIVGSKERANRIPI